MGENGTNGTGDQSGELGLRLGNGPGAALQGSATSAAADAWKEASDVLAGPSAGSDGVHADHAAGDDDGLDPAELQFAVESVKEFENSISITMRDGRYLARCAEFPKIKGFGANEEAARASLCHWLQRTIAAMHAAGVDIPKPGVQQVIKTLKMPTTQVDLVKQAASREGISFSEAMRRGADLYIEKVAMKDPDGP